jgi:flavin reductase (DIM6/NTAB) family NADH-FMN oxidoreductase RutF
VSAALALAAPVEQSVLDRERRAFIRAMRAAVTGVSVVTTDGAGGRLGLTVSALASVSAEPAMLLVCIARRSPLVAAIRTNAVFGVNVLGDHQAVLAETFAGRAPTRFDFGAARWQTGATGVPLLAGAASRFDCVVASTVEAGSHTVVIGDVLTADAGAAAPLAYAGGTYARLSRGYGSGTASDRV